MSLVPAKMIAVRCDGCGVYGPSTHIEYEMEHRDPGYLVSIGPEERVRRLAAEEGFVRLGKIGDLCGVCAKENREKSG